MKLRAVMATAFCALMNLVIMAPTQASEDIELVRYMGTMQYMAHKAGLAIGMKNQPLASFYVHEIEEIIERLEAVETYDGHAIGSLVKSILVPSFEALEGAVKSGDWQNADKGFERLLASCNTCHETTDHTYIRIQRSTVNPFMQSFESR